MNAKEQETRVPSLVKLLTDLADELDGIADLGMVVCHLDESRMAGRHTYFIKRAEKLRDIVDGILLRLRIDSHMPELDNVQKKLTAGVESLLDGFVKIEQWRVIETSSMNSSIERLRLGWETLHVSILKIALLRGMIDEPWYLAISERQSDYLEKLENGFAAMREFASAKELCTTAS